MISVLAASLLLSSTYAKERIGGYMGFADMIEHSEEAEQAGANQQSGSTGSAVTPPSPTDPKPDHKNHSGYEKPQDIVDTPQGYMDTVQQQKENMAQHVQDHYDGKPQSQTGDTEQQDMEDLFYQEANKCKEEILSTIDQELKDPTLPKEVKKLLKEVKKAIKFYKQEDLFKDLDLSHPDMEKIKERVKEAYKKRVEKIKQSILKAQNRVVLPVSGEFVQYGHGPFDWVYVTTSGVVYNLVGVDKEKGTFKYEKLSGVKGFIDDDGRVKFITTSQEDLAKLLAQLEAKGYPFVKYNDESENGFDWVIVTKTGKIYKLEGYDEDTGSFVYTPVEGLVAEQEGDKVEFLPGQEA